MINNLQKVSILIKTIATSIEFPSITHLSVKPEVVIMIQRFVNLDPHRLVIQENQTDSVKKAVQIAWRQFLYKIKSYYIHLKK